MATALVTTSRPNITAVPLGLRANDIVNHVVNIDSRFRQRPPTQRSNEATDIIATETSSASNFYYFLNPPIKNVLRIRVTSVEFPNNYAFFTANRHNTSLRILYTANGTGMSKVITLPDGNYTAEDMVTTLTQEFEDPENGLTWLTVAFDPITGVFTFAGTQRFGIDAAYDSYERPFDYGLAYYLGFTRTLHKSYKSCPDPSATNCWELKSDLCANFAGDSYVFLKINDYACVRHQAAGTEIRALAKILLREPKNFMVYDDYAGHHTKEVVFPQPQNLSRLHIQIVDAYGEPIDLCASNFSLSLEVLEIRNSSLYTVVLDSLGAGYLDVAHRR